MALPVTEQPNYQEAINNLLMLVLHKRIKLAVRPEAIRDLTVKEVQAFLTAVIREARVDQYVSYPDGVRISTAVFAELMRETR